MSANLDHRIIVFGREGLAREQLVIALSDYGVVPVWVGSPIQCTLEILTVLDPNQVVVSLEPSIESDLEPFNEFLSQQSISVLYDDAESTKYLSGWDLNRWARHLASKLLNMDYMPPAPDQDLVINHEQKNANKDSSTFDLQDIDSYDSIEIDSSELNAALEKLNENLSISFNIADGLDIHYEQLDSMNEFEIVGIEASTENEELLFKSDFYMGIESSENTKLQGSDVNNQQAADSEEHLVYMDEDALKHAVNALDMQLAASAPAVNLNSNLELQTDDAFANTPVSGGVELTKSREFDLSKYTLVNEQDEANRNELESENYSHCSNRSMFLVISGIGGPGVVRSILGNINSNFAGILVLSQAIEASQLPKLMVQLQKMISTPIVIPETDEYLLTGHIYLLPEKHAIQLTSLGYQCVDNKSLADFLEQMDQNVEIVVLSGADASLAQSLIQINQLMNNIHVQPPEECFDATLPQLLANIGAPPIRNDILATWFN